jgi:hypothetical protein
MTVPIAGVRFGHSTTRGEAVGGRRLAEPIGGNVQKQETQVLPGLNLDTVDKITDETKGRGCSKSSDLLSG